MNRYVQIGITVFALILLIGFVTLGMWDAPAPTTMIDTELDDSRFPR